jgi:hypothetical protein
MAHPWRVTFRRGGRVERLPAETLEQALALLEARVRAAAAGPGRAPVDLRVRRYEPGQPVTARAELRGPEGRRAGIDVRGDGTAAAWTGRIRRAELAAEPGEDAYAALRRVLSPSTSVDP